MFPDLHPTIRPIGKGVYDWFICDDTPCNIDSVKHISDFICKSIWRDLIQLGL